MKGKRWFLAFMDQGNCWKWRFRRTRYGFCTHYTFWRFLLSIDRPL